MNHVDLFVTEFNKKVWRYDAERRNGKAFVYEGSSPSIEVVYDGSYRITHLRKNNTERESRVGKAVRTTREML